MSSTLAFFYPLGIFYPDAVKYLNTNWIQMKKNIDVQYNFNYFLVGTTQLLQKSFTWVYHPWLFPSSASPNLSWLTGRANLSVNKPLSAILQFVSIYIRATIVRLVRIVTSIIHFAYTFTTSWECPTRVVHLCAVTWHPPALTKQSRAITLICNKMLTIIWHGSEASQLQQTWYLDSAHHVNNSPDHHTL